MKKLINIRVENVEVEKQREETHKNKVGTMEKVK